MTPDSIPYALGDGCGNKGCGAREFIHLFAERGVYTPPHYMHEFENKGVAKWAPHKCMKRKGLLFLGSGWGEILNGKGDKGRRKEGFGGSPFDQQVGIFVRKILQTEENKGVEPTGGGEYAGGWKEGPSGAGFSNSEDFGHTSWGVRLVLENPHHRPIKKVKSPRRKPGARGTRRSRL
jgi:hypothetical protein